VAEPRWLTEIEQQAWRAWIDAARHVFASIDRQLRTDAGITDDDYEVLVRLSEQPERRLRMSELAASVTNSPSRLSQRIDRLAARGWVERVPCETDRRVSYACLTDDGFAFLEAAAPGHVEEVRRRFVDRLTPAEIETLAAILPRLVDDEPPGSG
jgi:DNA-binding MarR family transcriptional regulator